jgi:dipeptide/tripeptide permease
MIPALGPGLVKPCVAGTTARASAENVRSLGFSVYYTLVNIGGALGPLMAWLVRKQLGLGMENMFGPLVSLPIMGRSFQLIYPTEK